jgi:hypothetical protein
VGYSPFGFLSAKGCGPGRVDRERPWEDLSEGEAATRGGDGAAELFGGFEPFLNNDFYVDERLLVGISVDRRGRLWNWVVDPGVRTRRATP